jgi:hypothetical protein
MAAEFMNASPKDSFYMTYDVRRLLAMTGLDVFKPLVELLDLVAGYSESNSTEQVA